MSASSADAEEGTAHESYNSAEYSRQAAAARNVIRQAAAV